MKTLKERSRQSGSRRRTLDWKRLPKVVLLSGGAALVGWWCVNAAAGEALASTNPLAAAQLVPDDPRVAIGLARFQFRTRQGAADPAVMQRALAALARMPLASEPFFFAGMTALSARDEDKGRDLVLEARRRDPRDVVARIVALDGQLRAGRVAEAAAEVTTISRLLPEAAQVLVPELAKFAANPRTRAALRDVLKSDPSMQAAVLEHLAGKGTDPQLVLSLAPPLSGRAAVGQAPAWQSKLLNAVLDRGDLGEARVLWARFAGLDPAKLAPGLYDGRFERLPGPAPFNWQFTASAAGVAEPTRAPALQVEYYGRSDAELASQLVPLRAGSYRLSMAASGNTPRAAGEGGLTWRAICSSTKAELGSLPVRELTYAPKRIAASFTVPSGCPAVWLRLVGTGTEFPSTHSVTLTNLQLRPAT